MEDHLWVNISENGFLGSPYIPAPDPRIAEQNSKFGRLRNTLLYMLFVLVTGCYKVVKPDIESTLKDDHVSDDNDVDGVFVELPPMLRMAEVTTESYPQSVLGEQSAPSVLCCGY